MTINDIKKISVKITEINPGQAAQWLANTTQSIESGKFRQRNISMPAYSRTCADIINGNWTINSDAIMISDKENILNGQHRLSAIVKANIPVISLLMTNVPEEQTMRSGKSISTILNLDAGKPRGIGQQLQISQGLSYGNKYAAIAKIISRVFTGSAKISITASQTIDILDIFKSSIDRILNISTHRTTKLAGVITGLAIYFKCSPDLAEQFAVKLFTLENISQKHPAMLLDIWLRNLRPKSDPLVVTSMMIQAVNIMESGQPIERLKSSDSVIPDFVKKYPKLVKQVNEIVNGVKIGNDPSKC